MLRLDVTDQTDTGSRTKSCVSESDTSVTMDAMELEMAIVATVKGARGDLYPVGSAPVHAALNLTANVGEVA